MCFFIVTITLQIHASKDLGVCSVGAGNDAWSTENQKGASRSVSTLLALIGTLLNSFNASSASQLTITILCSIGSGDNTLESQPRGPQFKPPLAAAVVHGLEAIKVLYILIVYIVPRIGLKVNSHLAL